VASPLLLQTPDDHGLHGHQKASEARIRGFEFPTVGRYSVFEARGEGMEGKHQDANEGQDGGEYPEHFPQKWVVQHGLDCSRFETAILWLSRNSALSRSRIQEQIVRWPCLGHGPKESDWEAGAQIRLRL
jgi:hypothetical protein